MASEKYLTEKKQIHFLINLKSEILEHQWWKYWLLLSKIKKFISTINKQSSFWDPGSKKLLKQSIEIRHLLGS